MTRLKRYPYCMTLRLGLTMESALEDLAYDSGISKAALIRRLLAQGIATANHDKAARSKGERRERGL